MPRADIEDVIRRYEDELLGRPGVAGVGVGSRGGHPVIEVLVTASPAPEGAIPTTLEGFDVQVKDIGVPTTQAGDGPD